VRRHQWRSLCSPNPSCGFIPLRQRRQCRFPQLRLRLPARLVAVSSPSERVSLRSAASALSSARSYSLPVPVSSSRSRSSRGQGSFRSRPGSPATRRGSPAPSRHARSLRLRCSSSPDRRNRPSRARAAGADLLIEDPRQRAVEAAGRLAPLDADREHLGLAVGAHVVAGLELALGPELELNSVWMLQSAKLAASSSKLSSTSSVWDQRGSS